MALELKDAKEGKDCWPEKTIKCVENKETFLFLELFPLENKCVNCDKILKSRQDLCKHVQQLHSKAKAFKCGDCRVLLTNMICLSHHMENHKVDTSEKYVCQFCTKEFICSNEFKHHLKLHNTEECSKSSNDNVSIKKHECEYCSKTFDRIFNLKRHLRVHTGERPFSCTMCKKAYKEKCDLANHQKFHILEKKLNGVLKGHLRTSAGERPYSCSLCEKSYKEMRHLTRHQKTHEQLKTEKSKSCLNSSKVKKRKTSSATPSEINVGHHRKSTKNKVEHFINKLDIKEELYSDSDSLDDLEVKNMIEICKTEYIYDDDYQHLEEKCNVIDLQQTKPS